MQNVNDALRALLTPEQKSQLDVVKAALTANPKLLDNHSRDLRGNQEKGNAVPSD